MAEQWRYLGSFVYNSEAPGLTRETKELAEVGMVKGVFLALGILVLLALIPVVNVIGIPFGAFIGAYYGISSTGHSGRSFLFKSLAFGGLLGLLVLLVLVAVAAGLTLAVDLSQRFQWLLWISVFTFALYSANMGALGAMYYQLKKSK